MEDFIEQVKSFPCLWDMGHSAYKDFDVMEKAWSAVAMATGHPDAKSAKVQWKKLRDNFREALKRQKDSKGGRVWRYQQQMEFLIPYMQSKNGDLICDGDKFSNEYSELVPYSEDKRQDGGLDDDANDSCSSFPRKKRKTVSYMDDMRAEDITRSNLTSRRNALLNFFNSMYNTTEELPPHLQLQVKRKVFEIVTEAEETALALQDEYKNQAQEYDVQDFL